MKPEREIVGTPLAGRRFFEAKSRPSPQRPFEVIAADLFAVVGEMHGAYRRHDRAAQQTSDAFGKYVASLPRSTTMCGWLGVLAHQIDDKHHWCSEYENRVLVPLVQGTGKMQAVRASIFYYLCDAVALRNAVKNWLRFLEQTAAVQGDPLPPDFVGQCIKRFNRTVKTIEIGRNRLTHNPAHSWDDLGHFDPALASEVHRIGSAHEQKSKEQIVDDILDAFLSANAILNSALSETAQAVRPHVQTTAERAGQILREL